uniref:Killer cell lectin like receptor F1 n=1 Tax=Ovis aries TaxID=9940 RepID=A0AC11AU56_SHEEP
MQDEETYMTLNIQSKKRSSIQTFQFKCQDCSVMSHRYKILLGISGGLNGILVLTLITLSLLVSQEVLPKCLKEYDSNITQHDDTGYLEVNSDTRGNIHKKDAGHCASRATGHKGFYTENSKTIKLCVDWA